MYIAPLNRKKFLRKAAPGFLLIEIMIAFVIMTSMALVIAHYQGAIINGQRTTQLRLQAVDALRSFLDEIKAQNSLPSSQDYEQNEFTITWNSKPYHQPFSKLTTHFDKNFRIIEASIRWENAVGKTEKISMQTGLQIKRL